MPLDPGRRREDNSRMLRNSIRALALMALVFTLIPGRALAQGCAMCGTALQDQSDPLVSSFNASILFMMSMPFTLFFSVAGWLLFRHRRPSRTTMENGS